MIETKKYDLRLVNFIDQLVDRITIEEMAKYTKACELKLPDYYDIDYELKQIKRNGEYLEISKVAEQISSTLSDDESIKESLKVIIEDSLYSVNSIVGIKKEISKLDVLNVIENIINNFSFLNNEFSNIVKPIVATSFFVENFYKSEFKKNKNTNSMISFITKYIKEKISKIDNYTFDDLMKDSNNVIDLINLVNNIFDSLKQVDYISESSSTLGINEILVNNGVHEYYSEKFDGNSSQIINLNADIIFRNKLKSDLINSIVYTSASSECSLYKYDEQSLYIQNGIFIPKSVFEKIVDLLPSNISNAMANYYMFLSGDEVSFSDRDGKKYSFSIDNIHILGLKNDVDILINYFERIALTNQLDSVLNLEIVECPKDTKLFDGKIDNLLGSLSNVNSSLEERIKCLNNAQGLITDYMTTDSIEHEIELLVYFYSLNNNDVLSVNVGLKEKFLNIETAKLDVILKDSSYCFGQKFIKEFKTNKRNEYFNKFCLMYNDEKLRKIIVKKYDNIINVQKYLNYMYKSVSKDIVGSLKNSKLTKDQVKTYFLEDVSTKEFSYETDNSFTDSLNNTYTMKYINDYSYEVYDGTTKLCRILLDSESLEIVKILEVNSDYRIESSSKRRLKIRKNNEYNEILNVDFEPDKILVNQKNKKMNIFSLADIYMIANYEQIKDGLDVDLSTITSLINIFKIYDKCLYLNNFNFSVDISNLFVVDIQKNTEMGFICEMSALNDALYALFDYMDNDGSTHFVSIQDSDSLMLLSSIVSLFPDVINFNGKEYKSIFGFCEKNKDKFSNILTQTHYDFKKNVVDLEQFINKLKNRSIILRYATSGIVDRTYDVLNSVTNINDMSLFDLVERNLYGCSNALLWLENVTLEQFKEFIGVEDLDTSRFNIIKMMLYKQIQENIVSLGEKKVFVPLNKYIDNYSNREIILDNILNINYKNKDTFMFMANMNDNELKEFIRDLYLFYPSYIIEFIHEQFEHIWIFNNNLAVIHRELKNILANFDNISVSLGKKNDDNNLLMYLDNKISLYERFIERELLYIDNPMCLINVYSEMIYFMEQKDILLTDNKLELEQELNKNGVVAKFKNTIGGLESRKDSIDNELKKVSKKIDFNNKVLTLLGIIKEFIDCEDVSKEHINDIFKNADLFEYIPSVIKEMLFNKMDYLLHNNALNNEIVNGLNALIIRFDCDRQLKKYYLDISKYVNNAEFMVLNARKDLFHMINSQTMYNNASLTETNYRLGVQKNLDGQIRKKIDSMMDYLSVKFGSYPEYYKIYMADVDDRIKELFVNKKTVISKDVVELFTLPVINDYEKYLSSVKIKYQNQIINHLELDNSTNEKVQHIIDVYFSLINTLKTSCEDYYENTITVLDSKICLKADDGINIKNQLIEKIPSSNDVFEEFIFVVLKFIELKIQNKYGDFITDSYKNKNHDNDLTIKNFIYNNLIILFHFIDAVVTPENGFENSVELKSKYCDDIKEKMFELLFRNKIVFSPELIDDLMSDEALAYEHIVKR